MYCNVVHVSATTGQCRHLFHFSAFASQTTGQATHQTGWLKQFKKTLKKHAIPHFILFTYITTDLRLVIQYLLLLEQTVMEQIKFQDTFVDEFVHCKIINPLSWSEVTVSAKVKFSKANDLKVKHTVLQKILLYEYLKYRKLVDIISQ
jgi:hypothetical protein